MNADVRILLADAERALRAANVADARAAFLEAGACAASYQLWRNAVRCYRRALELDLASPEPVTRIVELPGRVIARHDWTEYVRVLEHRPWPSFGCRTARVVTGELGSKVECPGVGVVMELMMSEDDLIKTRPEARFTGMPLAMAMIILRRAMWFAPRDLAEDPSSLRVMFDGRPLVRLEELGDWEPVAGAPQR